MRADTEYLTTTDLARRWRLSVWTIRDYARRGLITGASRAGRVYRFAPEATLQVPAASRPAMSDAERSTMFDRFTRELQALGRS